MHAEGSPEARILDSPRREEDTRRAVAGVALFRPGWGFPEVTCGCLERLVGASPLLGLVYHGGHGGHGGVQTLFELGGAPRRGGVCFAHEMGFPLAKIAKGRGGFKLRLNGVVHHEEHEGTRRGFVCFSSWFFVSSW